MNPRVLLRSSLGCGFLFVLCYALHVFAYGRGPLLNAAMGISASSAIILLILFSARMIGVARN